MLSAGGRKGKIFSDVFVEVDGLSAGPEALDFHF